MIISDKIYMDTSTLGFRLTELCQLFTYANPEYHQKKAQNLSTKDISQFLYHYKIVNHTDHQQIILPRGALPKIKEFLTQHNIPIRILDKRQTSSMIDINLSDDVILDTNQLNLKNILIRNVGGLIESPPGSGKTITMLGLISELKQKTLILMHELRLLNQWMHEITKKLNGNFSLKSIGDGKKELGDITVGIINTAYSMIKENPSVFDQFGVLVLDEVQHVPATMFTKVINNIPAKYRIGVTGTVKRKDGKHILIYDMIGETLKSVSESNLKHRITDFEYKQILTNIDFKLPTVSRWSGSSREKNIDPVKCLTLLTSSDIRNNIILENVVSNVNSGYLPLILSDRVKHCKELHSRLIELGYKTILLIGETRKKLKWEDIRDDNTIDCVVAIGKIASEGLDMPMLSSIHLTCPSSNLPQLKQRIGRIRRYVNGKQIPLVYDYVDNLAYYIKTETDGASRKIYSYKNSAYNRLRFIKKIKKEYLDGDTTISE